MGTPGSGPLDVVIVYAFDCTSSTPDYNTVDKVYGLVREKMGRFADSCLSYIYVMSTPNSCTTEKRFAGTNKNILPQRRTDCTKNMASGLPEAHRLISQAQHPNGIVLLFSDGVVNKGDFFDGAEEFVSTVPVHTFTLHGDAYNYGLRAMAANSQGGRFHPLPVPDEPKQSGHFSQLLDRILGGTMNDDDEEPPPSDAADNIGLVTMKPPKYSKTDVALKADSLRVEVKLNAASGAAAREGLDLVAVLDVSGSMKEKIESVKKAMQFVIMKLTAKDRLSIVTFSGEGTRRCRLRSMTPAAKAHLLETIVDKLAADGGTNIKDGLEKGLAVVNDRVHREGRTANIFLMSDGVQTDGDARAVDPGKVAVYTFGFGKGTDHQLLTDIAKKSPGGTFSCVPEGSNLSDFFARLLGGLLTIVAQDVKLILTSRLKQVDTMVVPAGLGYTQATKLTDEGDTEITIFFGTIFSGEARTVSVDFTLKPSKNKSKFSATIAEAIHSYNAQLGVQTGTPTRIVISRTPKPTAVPSIDSAELHAEEVRNQVADSIRAAMELADSGKLEDARYRLQNALNAVENIMLDDGQKMAGALRAELLQLIKLMASEDLYKELGRPYALATETSHARQRTAGKGDDEPAGLYDTPRMITCVQQAKKFEKDPAGAPVPSADEDVKQEIAANPLAAVAAPLALYLQNAIEALQAIQKILAPAT